MAINVKKANLDALASVVNTKSNLYFERRKEMNVKQSLGGFSRQIDKNLPTILTVSGVIGLGITVAITWTQAPKAKEIIKAKKQQYADTAPDDNEAKRQVIFETVKEAAPVVAPIIISAGATAACIIGSDKLHLKREAALTGLYVAASETLRDFKESAKENLDKKDYEKVEEGANSKRVDRAIAANPDILTKTMMPGQFLFLDGPTNELFVSNKDRVEKIIDDYNDKLDRFRYDNTAEYVRWNDLRRDLGLKDSTLGYTRGWNVGSRINATFDSRIIDELGGSVIVLDYNLQEFPEYG